MQIRVAPERPTVTSMYTERIFLAGGITNCPKWQEKTISHLSKLLKHDYWDTRRLLILNPRREYFPMDNPDAAYEQIKWEFDALESCQIFTMYFCKGDSVQPICMYELGRNIARMQERFKNRWSTRIIVSVEDGYSRAQDVIIQCGLTGVLVHENATPESHAQLIANAWADLYGGH